MFKRIHQAQWHNVMRTWQCGRNNISHPDEFVLPMFIISGGDNKDEKRIETVGDCMPGVLRYSPVAAIEYLTPLVRTYNLRSVLLFPVRPTPNETQSTTNTNRTDDNVVSEVASQIDQNPVLYLIPLLAEKLPELMVICDVCLCAFTQTGHCCVFHYGQNNSMKSTTIDGPWTRDLMGQLSLAYARAGTHVVAPSCMQDGHVQAIRDTLDENKYQHVAIVAYAAKFASCLYGPFRAAAHSAPTFGDRRTYQLPIGSRQLALRAVGRDLVQGADCIMVKPSTLYLDIVNEIRTRHPDVPVAVYHVSGEYSMMLAGVKNGLFDLDMILDETLASFRRAGASIIISYFTPYILKRLKDQSK